ncbi:hypothetical protein L3Y34_011442 [Caenorhabditis briggsae]|uniref:Uncharacterized protein n=3 Tax=Caenorhabditis briggsae TaxID=6238 RepID=A0AAE8ZNW7_CAEBR|nr:hypothetical protein L3Y34_011442 [Caenorhabditis briggsae]
MIRLIFLFVLSTAPSFGISCYGYNDYQEVVETLHHRKFCTAVYEVSDGTGAFGGGERHPSRIPNVVNMTKGNDCVMQHVQSNLGIPSSDMWLCYCYTEMCNYPFTWKEFVSRGYTLKPTYAAGFEKKIEGSESEASTEDLQDTEGQGRTDETLFIEKENTTTNTDNLLESFVDTEGPENSVISNSCDDNIDIITDSIIRINSSISDSSSSGSPHFVRSPSLKEKFFHGYMYADSDVSGKEDKMHRLNRTNDRVEKKNESLLRILDLPAGNLRKERWNKLNSPNLIALWLEIFILCILPSDFSEVQSIFECVIYNYLKNGIP